MGKFYIEKLVVTGPGKQPSFIEFAKGVNVIMGPSNTGKSYVMESLDYLFGFTERTNRLLTTTPASRSPSSPKTKTTVGMDS